MLLPLFFFFFLFGLFYCISLYSVFFYSSTTVLLNPNAGFPLHLPLYQKLARRAHAHRQTDRQTHAPLDRPQLASLTAAPRGASLGRGEACLVTSSLFACLLAPAQKRSELISVTLEKPTLATPHRTVNGGRRQGGTSHPRQRQRGFPGPGPPPPPPGLSPLARPGKGPLLPGLPTSSGARSAGYAIHCAGGSQGSDSSASGYPVAPYHTASPPTHHNHHHHHQQHPGRAPPLTPCSHPPSHTPSPSLTHTHTHLTPGPRCVHVDLLWMWMWMTQPTRALRLSRASSPRCQCRTTEYIVLPFFYLVCPSPPPALSHHAIPSRQEDLPPSPNSSYEGRVQVLTELPLSHVSYPSRFPPLHPPISLTVLLHKASISAAPLPVDFLIARLACAILRQGSLITSCSSSKFKQRLVFTLYLSSLYTLSLRSADPPSFLLLR